MAIYPVRRRAGRLFETQLDANFENLDARITALETGTNIAHAERVVLSTYGDTVSVSAKAKSLNKFGRNANCDAGQRSTVATWPGATQYNETFVATNLIDSVVSSNAGDTMTVTIEGHTIDGSGNLTFTVQSATLTGQTPVALGTSLARATRLYISNSGTFNSPQSDAFAGDVSVYDSSATTVTAGVPNTATGVHLWVEAGQNQSRKAATSISSQDYYFVTTLDVSVRGTTKNNVEFQLERRDVANGGVFRPIGAEVSLSANQPTATLRFEPYLIIPKNHDVRLIAIADTNNTEVTGEFQGFLAAVQT